MFPVGDDNESGAPAAIVFGLIAVNVIVFLLEISRPSDQAVQAFVQAWGVVPREFAARKDFVPLIPLPYWSTIVTSMFLHGGWGHLFGNMLYLWIFGDNLERAMGPIRFLVFYLVCGIVAAAAHIFLNLGSHVPTVGASGAISGVLGGYLVLFPRNRVRVIAFYQVIAVPAFLVLGLWILMQFIGGFGAVANTEETGGIAFAAHIGGFIAGAVLVKLFATRRVRAQIL